VNTSLSIPPIYHHNGSKCPGGPECKRQMHYYSDSIRPQPLSLDVYALGNIVDFENQFLDLTGTLSTLVAISDGLKPFNIACRISVTLTYGASAVLSAAVRSGGHARAIREAAEPVLQKLTELLTAL
jgi:hypothetical protein